MLQFLNSIPEEILSATGFEISVTEAESLLSQVQLQTFPVAFEQGTEPSAAVVQKSRCAGVLPVEGEAAARTDPRALLLHRGSSAV